MPRKTPTNVSLTEATRITLGVRGGIMTAAKAHALETGQWDELSQCVVEAILTRGEDAARASGPWLYVATVAARAYMRNQTIVRHSSNKYRPHSLPGTQFKNDQGFDVARPCEVDLPDREPTLHHAFGIDRDPFELIPAEDREIVRAYFYSKHRGEKSYKALCREAGKNRLDRIINPILARVRESLRDSEIITQLHAN